MDTINLKIFKAYDIRGIYPAELDEDVAYRIGAALVDFLNVDSVVIGHDMRKSADSIFDAISRGITDSGCDVIDIGMVSTPMLNFTVAHYGYSCGVMITASHNPPEYNGFKICTEDAVPVHDEDIKRIGQIANMKTKPLQETGSMKTRGKVVKKDVWDDYREHVFKFARTIFKNKRKIKVVADAANCMASITVPGVFSKLGDFNIEIIPLYFELDGSFPNHEPDPLKVENMEDLRKKVLEEGADFGVGFDGDVDRAIFVDDRGDIVRADLITALFAGDFLKYEKGAGIIYDLRSSMIVPEVIEKNGGKEIMCRVGHAFIKKKMREYDALFGGELSGHYYFRDNFYADSADIAFVEILNILTSAGAEGKNLSDLLAPLKKYYHSGEINSEVEDKDGKIKEIEGIYSDGRISHLDGILVEYDSWRFNIRKSNTEPLLRLNLEADTLENMEKYRDKLLGEIRG